MAMFGLAKDDDTYDEIKEFQMGRYISSNEAVWKILGFYIHERYPSVIQLAVHLENGQRVYFNEKNVTQKVLNPQNTTLTAFFELCQKDEFASTLIYNEVPKYYTWNAVKKQFKRRKQGIKNDNYPDIYSTETLGRVYTIHPNNAECFFLRLLLHTIKGPKSFDDLKKVKGELCSTYREACLKLGLLENDEHWNNALKEAALSSSPKQIRDLFAIILTTCSPSDPKMLWETYKDSMSEDVMRKQQEIHSDCSIDYREIYNETLILLENSCLFINNKNLNNLGLHSPERVTNEYIVNIILITI